MSEIIDTAIRILSIFAMIGVGVLASRRRWFSEDFSTQLSKLLITVFYPCLLFSAILRNYTLEKIAANWSLPAGVALILLLGWGIGWIGKRTLARHYRAPTRRAFHFACAMNNYSFLPIMLIAGMPLGEKGVAMVAVTTIASDTLMWTLGFSTLTAQKIHLRSLAKSLARPPLMALMAAVLLLAVTHFAGINLASIAAGTNTLGLPDPNPTTGHTFIRILLDTLYKYLGQATIPTSAIVCGMRMGHLKLRGLVSRIQMITLALRMVLVPAVAILILCLLPIDPDRRLVFTVISLMPGAMVGVSMSEVYGGDIPFISASILNTHLLCIVTIPLGLWIMHALTGA